MNNDLYFKDCFTEIEEGKVNADFNKATVKCFDSKDNKFSMDCDGNLVVNSIITREGSPVDLTIDTIYPVGSIYMSVSQVNPSNLFGGTWEAWGNGRVPVGVDESQEEFKVVEKSGGSKSMQTHNHIGSTDSNGSHRHGMGCEVSAWEATGYGLANVSRYSCGFNDRVLVTGPGCVTDIDGNHGHSFTTSNSGEGNSQNLQPYITCYMWKRVA